MITKRVIVLPYDEQWKYDFLQMKAELTNVLGQLVVDVLKKKAQNYILLT